MTEANSNHSAPAWEARFRAPRTLWVQIAREQPERGLASTNRTGAYQVERWRVPTGELEPITEDPSGKTAGWLSPDGGWVVWHADRDGNEFGHFVTTPWDQVAPRDLTPDLPLYSTFAAGFAADGWFAGAIVGDDLVQLVVVPWSGDGPGTPVSLDPGPGFVTQVALGVPDGGGRRPLAYGTTAGEGLSTVLRVVDAEDGRLIHEVRQLPGAVTPVAYAQDGGGSLLASTTASGVLRPILVDRTGTVREYDLADVEGDLEPVAISPDGRIALLVASARSVERLEVLDLNEGTLRPLDTVTGTVTPFSPGFGTFFSPTGSIVVTREDATTPAEVVEVDPARGARLRTLITAPSVPRSVPFRSVDVASTGGAVVQGWLATPDVPGPFPTILELHGGPQAKESDRFHAQAQAWVDRGYAFFALNYRGSTGFGREYEQAIWGQVGRLELEDMVAARDHLVATGVARADAISLTGASYGGYLTLLGLGRRPDLWVAGVAIVAIADWRLMYEDGVSLREYQEAFFQGTPEEKPDLHAEASPITYVDRLTAPLLVIQGRNDARCPARQMEVYVDRARSLGKQIEVDWFDAGHGHGSIETRIAWARRSMEFVERALESRPGA